MYRVITVEREYGCGGGEIAAGLARRLDWTLWDHSLTQEIAKVANVECTAVERCEERADSTFRRLVHTFLRGSYERNMAPSVHQPFNTDQFVSVGKQVMENVAQEGKCVIVGRGAPYFLRERHDAFHVFLYASFTEKLRRLQQLGKSQSEAEEMLEQVDQDRIIFVNRYFNADWPTRCLYHVMINTAIGNQNVISTILETKRTLEENVTKTPPSLQSCEPGPRK